MAIILVEIDGVLNPFLSYSSSEEGAIHVSIGWASWSLNFKTHGKWLEALSKENRIVWCSSWEEESNKVSEIFCIPEFEYVTFKPRITELPLGHMWKLNDVVKFIGDNDDLVIWLDTEFEKDAYEWAKYRGLEKTILIECDSSVGWTYAEYVNILKLLE